MPCRDVLQDSVNGATRMRRPGPAVEAKHLPIRGRRVVLHVRTSYVVNARWARCLFRATNLMIVYTPPGHGSGIDPNK